MDPHFLLILMVLCWKRIDAKEKSSVSIVFGGDVDFSRLTRYNHHLRNCSYTDSLKRLKNYFMAADFAMINLETTIGESTDLNINAFVGLRSDESVIPALKDVGISYVGIANNHIQDFREAGTNKTTDLLQKYGIKYSGVIYGTDRYAKQKPLILEKNGLKIGILSYCDVDRCEMNWENLTAGPPLLKEANVISEVSSLRKEDGCDIVILFLHWGIEYASIVNIVIVGLIRSLTKNAQIDLIIGSHPHVKQKHWYTDNTLVATSLGNLLFSSYGLASFNFNIGPNYSHEEDALHEKLWYKQMKVMEDDTQHGKIMKVEFNRNGIMKDKTQYLRTKIFATKQHCLATEKDDNASWRTVCNQGDPECTGTATCNYIECDDDEPLPSISSNTPHKLHKP